MRTLAPQPPLSWADPSEQLDPRCSPSLHIYHKKTKNTKHTHKTQTNTNRHKTHKHIHIWKGWSPMLPISTHSTQNKNSKSAACHCLAYGAFDYWCCTARVPCDVFRFNRSGLVCALHMGPRADISIYDTHICIWGPARWYMSNLRLYLAETSLLARLNCLNCLNRLNCPALSCPAC